MTQEYYTLVTDIGIAKLTNAQITQTAVNLVQVAVGDGGGTPYNPTQSQTALVNERWRGQVASLSIDPDNENYINIEITIPSNVGGWMIREIGVFDDVGDLILVSKQPETFKPTFSMGSIKDMVIRLVMELSNTDVAELKIDPTIITASRAYVHNLFEDVDFMRKHILAAMAWDVDGGSVLTQRNGRQLDGGQVTSPRDGTQINGGTVTQHYI